jgi:hypothetical protein
MLVIMLRGPSPGSSSEPRAAIMYRPDTHVTAEADWISVTGSAAVLAMAARPKTQAVKRIFFQSFKRPVEKVEDGSPGITWLTEAG